MKISDSNRKILFGWIDDVTRDIICKRYQTPFLHLSSRILEKCLEHIPMGVKTYQLYAIGSMYISSCFSSDFPISLETLHELCVDTYTESEITNAVYDIVRSRTFCENVLVVQHDDDERMIYIRDDTRCQIVTDETTNTRYVRKTIHHFKNGLPRYSAMVELCTHFLLSSNTRDNVCSLKGVDIIDDSCCMYYDYHPYKFNTFHNHSGSTLREYVKQLATGINTLHSSGIAHRDIKPDNIQLSDSNVVHIIDFGSCGYGRERSTIPICTITHRSTEILRQEIDQTECVYDGMSLDMWSFGVILSELVLHRHVFGPMYESTTPTEVLAKIMYEMQILRASLIDSCEDTCIIEIIMGCLEPDPSNRWTVSRVLNTLN